MIKFQHLIERDNLVKLYKLRPLFRLKICFKFSMSFSILKRAGSEVHREVSVSAANNNECEELTSQVLCDASYVIISRVLCLQRAVFSYEV